MTALAASGLRVDLSTRELELLRALALPGESQERRETRLLALVRDGALVHAVRTDRGPLRELPDALPPGRLSGPRALRELPEAAAVDRVVAIDAAPHGLAAGAPLLAQVLAGRVQADPPWLASLESLRRAARRLRVPLPVLLPDGVYALLCVSATEAAPLAICLRLRGGSIERISGSEAIAGSDDVSSPSELLIRVRRQLGPLVLALVGGSASLAALLASPRPVSTLERARIRGEIEAPVVSRRLSATLLALRLLGL